MPRKRHRTPYNALSHSTPLYYPPSATTQHPSVSNLHIRIVVTAPPTPPPPHYLYLTPTPSRLFRPSSLPFPTNRSANPHYNRNNSNPAPSPRTTTNTPTATPPTDLVARSLLDTMNQSLPLKLLPPPSLLPPTDTPDSRDHPQNNHNSTPQFADVTPLLLGNSGIRSAQRKLGISPDSPSSYLVPIPPELERQLRQAQLAARKLDFDADTSSPRPRLSPQQCTSHNDDAMLLDQPVEQRETLDTVSKYIGSPMRANLPTPSHAADGEDADADEEDADADEEDADVDEEENERAQDGLTPVARRRRLSGISAVTPIPMFLESPPMDTDADAHAPRSVLPMSELEPQVALLGLGSQLASDAAVQKGIASPITPAQGDAPSMVAVGLMEDDEDANGIGRARTDKASVDVGSAADVPVDSVDDTSRVVHVGRGAAESQGKLKHEPDLKAPILARGIENLCVRDAKASKEEVSNGYKAITEKCKDNRSVSYRSCKPADNDEPHPSRCKTDTNYPVAHPRTGKTEAQAAKKKESPTQSLFKTAKGDPVRSTQSEQSFALRHSEQSNHKSIPSSSLFIKRPENSLGPQQTGKPALRKLDINRQPSLFTTAKGRPLHLPPSRESFKYIFEDSEADGTFGVSLFATGQGKPVRLSSDRSGRLPHGTSGSHGCTAAGANARTASLFTTGKGDPVHLPVPEEPVNGENARPAAASLFTTGKGKPIHLPASADPLAFRVEEVPLPPRLTTGKGVPLQKTVEKGTRISRDASIALEPLSASASGAPEHTSSLTEAKFPMKDTPEGISLFTTGKGIPVQIPSAANVQIDLKNFTPFKTPFKNSFKSTASNSLFTTGSGKKLSVPTRSKERSTSTGEIENDIVSRLFTTKQGNSFTSPDDNAHRSSYALRPRRSPQTPLTERCKNITSPTRNSLKAVGIVNERFQSRTPANKSTRGTKNRSRLKTTPFKRPRQIRRPQKYFDNARRGTQKLQAPVPLFDVPLLLKTGCMVCGKPDHHCAQGLMLKLPQDSPNYQNVGSLKRCHSFAFPSDYFGNIACVPAEITKLLRLHEKSVFGVQECVEWMKEWFPAVASKPASCVGSEAWTRLSYTLAVWKLARYTSICKAGSFLSAANIIRELLRRIYFEWHKNKQPHLLRMMRRDSAPTSHAVFVILDIEKGDEDRLIIFLSDGWYLARATIDKVLEERILCGRIRIGDKIHISGAGLQAASTDKSFFFGDGDELSNSMFLVSANNVRIRKGSQSEIERLGIQRSPLILNSLKWVLDDCGTCPTARVVILRSYPTFFVETVELKEDDVENAHKYVFLREEAEYEARARYEETMRQRLLASTELGQMAQFEFDQDSEIPGRNVRCVKEVLVCGSGDDATCSNARKLVRIYNPPGDVQGCLSKEGSEVLMTQLWPKKNIWVGKPEGILPAENRHGLNNSRLLETFPRKTCSIVDLQSGVTAQGSDFDGVFCVLHVTSACGPNDQRFVYLADDVGSEVGILALELSDYDSSFLPTVFRLHVGMGSKNNFVVVALRDIEFRAVSPKHDLVHVRASLRSSFTSCKALKRQKGNCGMKQALQRIELSLDGKHAQLEILREAVISFASGTRASIGAYFTSTQEM